MNAAKAKILVVDDEEAIRDLCREILEGEGYKVVTAENGEEAIKIISAEDFELALIDIRLPGIDGGEVRKFINRYKPFTEVIIITAYGNIEAAVEAMRGGAVDYITKPFQIDQVIIAVKRALKIQAYQVYQAQNEELQQEVRRGRDELKRRVYQIDTLYELSKAISYRLDFREILERAAKSMIKAADAELCTVLLFKQGAGQLNIRSRFPLDKEIREQIVENLRRASLTFRKKISMEELSINLKVEEEKKTGIHVKNKKIVSFCNVPLITQTGIVGMVNISSFRKNAFDEEDIKLLYTMTNQAAMAMERLRVVVANEKSRMEDVVRSMNDGVIMIDEKKELVVVNPAAKKMLGLKKEESLEYTHLPRLLKNLELVKLSGDGVLKLKNGQREIKLTKPRKMVLDVRISSVKDAKGMSIGKALILRDITELKKIDEMKSEFISTASHELRTPLASMKGAVSLVLNEAAGEINQTQKKFLQILNRNCDRLTRLVSNLLDLSRIEAGESRLSRELTNVNKVIAESVNSLRPQTERKKISLSTEIPQSLPSIFVDRDKLEEVFINLIDNAIKFTPPGGKISIQALEEESRLKFSVIDNGVGIPEEDIKNIFEKFRQLGNERGGTGLGLPISKDIIEAHGGKIWVESKIGEGSKFTFILPKESKNARAKNFNS